ncbi:MAG: GntR family transcriptional regulator [Verrucomicrobia bacterium]|nr:GntR family transcriptional regulator [Verrucomicrobiota bacterium]
MALSNQAVSSAADQVANALRLAILNGEFGPGQAVPQEEIAARFGVSRIPVRDAMNLLQAEGLLHIVPSKGSFVANPTPDEIRETYEIRVLIELEALRLAFHHHNTQSLARAERWLREFELETEPARLGDTDREFHAALYAPAKKAKLFELINSLRTLTNRGYFLQMSTPTHLKQCQAAHREIFENFKKRNLRAAKDSLRHHLLAAGSVVAESAAKFRAEVN